MESKDTPPKQSPVGSPNSPGASKSPVGSPKSPVSSPGKEPSKSPDQRSPSPTTGNLLPGTYWAEAPPEEDEVEDVASSTASLSSSVMQYRTIHGRTYHSSRGNAEYWGSNDEGQNDALDLLHHAHTVILGDKLFLAPLKDDIQKVVDIATGTGAWAIDFADEYPNCEVIGTDLSPIQPTWIPPNLKFEIDDCTQPWAFEPNSIDFVHLRYLVGSIQDWPALFKEAYRCIKPGGYVQSLDGGGKIVCEDTTVKEHTAIKQWAEFFAEGGKRIGRSFSIVPDEVQKTSMEEAGFVDIEVRDLKVPVGTWPKDPRMKQLGACAFRAIYDDVEGYMTYLAELLGWSRQEVLVFAAHFRKELRDQEIHKFYWVRVVWGRKPEA